MRRCVGVGHAETLTHTHEQMQAMGLAEDAAMTETSGPEAVATSSSHLQSVSAFGCVFTGVAMAPPTQACLYPIVHADPFTPLSRTRVNRATLPITRRIPSATAVGSRLVRGAPNVGLSFLPWQLRGIGSVKVSA